MLLPELPQGIQTTNARTCHTRLVVLWFPTNFIGFAHSAKLITGEFISTGLAPAGNGIKADNLEMLNKTPAAFMLYCIEMLP